MTAPTPTMPRPRRGHLKRDILTEVCAALLAGKALTAGNHSVGPDGNGFSARLGGFIIPVYHETLVPDLLFLNGPVIHHTVRERDYSAFAAAMKFVECVGEKAARKALKATQ